MYKNVAGQRVAIYAWDMTAQAPIAGDAANITADYALDNGADSPTNDANPTEVDAVNLPGVYYFDLQQAETNGDLFMLKAVSATADVEIDPVFIYTMPGTSAGLLANVTLISDDAAAANNAESFFDGTGYAGTNNVIPSVTTVTGNVNGSVGSVVGAVGSVTGAVGSVTGNVGGNVVGSVASVTGAVGSVTGAVGSVTGNVGGNVVGSVASVVGAVGSVTGAVGSVTGNVGGNVVGTVASVVGAVGSVAGNVGGNVVGTVGSVVGAVGSVAGNVVGSVGSVVGNVGGNVVGTVGSVVGAVGSVAGNVVGSVGSVVGNVGGNVVGSVASVVGAVGSVAGNVAGTIGGLTAAALANFFNTDSTTNYAAAVAGSVVKETADNAAVAADPWLTALPGAYAPGTAGDRLGDVDVAISTRATQANILSDATPFAGANVDATISSRAPAATALSTAVWTGAKAAFVDAAISTRATPAQILDAVIEAGYTLSDILQLLAARETGLATGGGTVTLTFVGLDGVTNRVVMTVDAQGNRTNVVRDVT